MDNLANHCTQGLPKGTEGDRMKYLQQPPNISNRRSDDKGSVENKLTH